MDELDLSILEVEGRGILEAVRRRGQHDLVERFAGILAHQSSAGLLTALGDHSSTARVTPDRQRREPGVPKRVVPMTVGVDDRDHLSGKRAQIVTQLVRSSMMGAGVDDDQAAVAADDTDRLVERFVSPYPDAIGDLAPDRAQVPSSM